MNQDPQIDEKIRLLCRLGKKVEAVKYYKDVSGLGLREAKDYVDALENGTSMNANKQPIDGNLDEQVLQLCQQGHRIEAIKLYRDATGSGLKESMEYVDRFSKSSTKNLQATDHWAGLTDDTSAMYDPSDRRNIFQKILAFFTGDKA